MGEIILVRHGQANSAAKDEASYDQLSDLGHIQAQWLGDWLRLHEYRFDHVLSGTLRRHRETVAGMEFAAEEDARLNEIEYFTLADALRVHDGTPHPAPDEFGDHLPKVMIAWAEARIEGSETYARFEARVAEMLAEAAMPGRNILCVTSGGVIGMFLRHLLKLDIERMSAVMLPIFNTSLHRIRVLPTRTILAGYNATPHLDPPDRAYARTHY